MHIMENSSTHLVIKRLSHQTEAFLTLRALLLGVIAIVGGVGNLAVVLKISASKTLRTVPNILSVTLSCIFLVQSSVDLPLRIYSCSLGDGDLMSKLLCRIMAWTFVSIDSSCVTLMAVIAFNKWAAVTKDPSFYQKLFSPKPACSIVFLAMVLINGSTFAYNIAARNNVQFDPHISYCILRPESDNVFVKLLFINVICLYIIGIVVSVLSYASIGWCYRQTRRKIQASRTIKRTGTVKKVNQKERQRMSKVFCLCAINVFFLLTWLPLLVIVGLHYKGKAFISSYTFLTVFVVSTSKIVFFPILQLCIICK